MKVLSQNKKLKNSSYTNSCGLVLFRLNPEQIFALGTLKVKELLPLRDYRKMPYQHQAVVGISYIRELCVPLIDMSAAVGFEPLSQTEIARSIIVLTDCMRMSVGFLVKSVDRIFDTTWQNISPPTSELGHQAFVTGFTDFKGQIVQIVDVEKILSNMFPSQEPAFGESGIDFDDLKPLRELSVLIVDDSVVARKQLFSVLDEYNVPCFIAHNGLDALKIMIDKAEAGDRIPILVSDIEMPGMDGYELSFEVKNNPLLKDTYIILHTSLASEISINQAKQVGAEEALEKFDSKELTEAMLRGARFYLEKKPS